VLITMTRLTKLSDDDRIGHRSETPYARLRATSSGAMESDQTFAPEVSKDCMGNELAEQSTQEVES
jgi:hypothetical protein